MTVASREFIWRRVMDDLSFEYAAFTRFHSGPELSGIALIAEDGIPLRAGYRIVCDRDWQTRTVDVDITWRGERHAVRLERDSDGRWRRDGEPAAGLAGCSDVDLEITPATNALPINRLGLRVSERREIQAAWVRFPSLSVAPARQSYERLSDLRYRYTSLESGFTAIVEVDEDGIPTDYERIWRRIAEGPSRCDANGSR